VSADQNESLASWTGDLFRLLDLPQQTVDIDLVLDLARDAAHGVARPAAPLTTFLVGLAAGRAGGSDADIERIARLVTEALAQR
jgi:hypothetical protein